jgi:serine/threonine protein kinase
MTRTDTWSDVYSVGLILWQMLTGEKLFQLDMSTGDAQTLARRVLKYVEVRTSFDEELLQRPRTVPKPLWQILLRSLRLDPRRRHPHAMELGHDIQRFLETGEALERDDSRTENIRLQDFLDFLEESVENEPTNVRGRKSDLSGVRPASSIPVVLDFDDETTMAPVVIPRHDPPPLANLEDEEVTVMADVVVPKEAFRPAEEREDLDVDDETVISMPRDAWGTGDPELDALLADLEEKKRR